MKTDKIILAILAAAAFVSCDAMFGEKPTGNATDDEMWQIPEAARGVLLRAYNDQENRPDTYDGNFLDAATDNAATNSFNSGVYKMGQGSISAANPNLNCWGSCYEELQHIHNFLEHGLTEKTRYEVDESLNAKTRLQLEAEAYYLRAWWSAKLLRFYGGRTDDGEALGYIIVTRFLSTDDASDFASIRRNTYEECVAQICEDLDRAAAVLPLNPTNDYVGRATAKMCEFLKARVLLWAASPAYQPESIVKINGQGDFTVVDPAAYAAKWERAAVQLQKVLDMPGIGNYVALKATDLADVDKAVIPSQFVHHRYFLNQGFESRHLPPFYYGSCNTTPSQNLVDAYPMKANGYPIAHPSSGYDPQRPYDGRDSRLALTVYHHGEIFGNSGTALDMTPGGKDSESFMLGGNRGTRTGYYMKKYIAQDAAILTPLVSKNYPHYYPMMRTAELFISLAEAANEAWGPEGTGAGVKQSAYDIMKTVRSLSGGIVDDQYIESIKGDRDAFRAMIQNERRIEFAFEDMRFWDMRRWLLRLDEPIRGCAVERVDEYSLDVVYDLNKTVEPRNYKDLRYYYIPIPYNEVMKNPNVKQNLGY